MSKCDQNYDFKKGQLALSNIDKQKEKNNKIKQRLLDATGAAKAACAV